MKPLIVCNGTTDTTNPSYNPLFVHDCGFNDLIVLSQNLITDLVLISTLLATMAFIYAAVLLLTSGGNPSKKDEAKKVFTKVLIGYLWILGAWLLVYTISTVLLNTQFYLLGP